MALDPSVAAVRGAVRRSLAALAAGHPGGVGPVLVACSGGADSLALLAATVHEARGPGHHVVGVTVDHGLQDGSDARAAAVVEQMSALGVDETATARVAVTASGQGPEAAAREARYAVLEEMAAHWRAGAVLLGHTLDDQAETVLLGLARGSGARALAGMRPGFGLFRRPLLEVTRAETAAACRAEDIATWDDPHNDDPRFTRSRVRHEVLPVLEDVLGPGVAGSLARTAEQLREDAEALDGLAGRALAEVRTPTGLDVAGLDALPTAVRRRVLRQAAVEAGAPAGEVFRVHVVALDGLVRDYRGQRRIELPGHVHAVRAEGEVRFARAAGTGPPPAVAG